MPAARAEAYAGHQTRGDGFHVALHSEIWPAKKCPAPPATPVSIEQSGRVDVSVAVDLAQAQELRISSPGSDAEFSPAPDSAGVLKAHQVIARGPQVFLTKLHHGVGPAAGSRSVSPTGFMDRSAGYRGRGAPVPRWKAGLEVRHVVGDVRLVGLGIEECVHEAVVLLSREWAVQ